MKLVPLNFSIATLITEEHIQLVLQEAELFLKGSREYRAFIKYAEILQRKLDKQNNLTF